MRGQWNYTASASYEWPVDLLLEKIKFINLYVQ